MGLGSFDGHLIFLPFVGGDIDMCVDKLLTFIHGILVDKLHTDASLTIECLCPYREAIRFILHHSNTEIALVLESRTAVSVSRPSQHHIVRTAFKRSVVLELHITEGLPAHKCLWELERAVFHQLTIETSIGGIVNVLKEETIHRVLNRRTCLLRVHGHHIALGCGS